ncbi:MAG TPA: hypothetical protein VMS93_01115 [Candidatus Saccharimonadales bacterium]|nr:hypothetical protein [Candidatus Saccharimonadales bacterium]
MPDRKGLGATARRGALTGESRPTPTVEPGTIRNSERIRTMV